MLMDTKLGLLLKRTSTLTKERVAWQSAFDGKLKNKIIEEWIQNDQLFEKGIDEDGDIIGLYSEWTEMINPEKVAGTPYTLKDTGAFYKSMFIIVLVDSFIIDGDGKKIDEFGKVTDLFKWLGEGIVGLTSENREKLKMEITEKFIKYVKEILQID